MTMVTGSRQAAARRERANTPPAGASAPGFTVVPLNSLPCPPVNGHHQCPNRTQAVTSTGSPWTADPTPGTREAGHGFRPPAGSLFPLGNHGIRFASHSLFAVAVEKLVHVGLVHAGEAPGGQRGQDVRVGAGRRPRHSSPPRGQRGRRALAAVAVGAPR